MDLDQLGYIWARSGIHYCYRHQHPMRHRSLSDRALLRRAPRGRRTDVGAVRRPPVTLAAVMRRNDERGVRRS